MRDILPRFEIRLEVLYGKHVKFQKHGKILSSYAENTLYCSDVDNLAQKLNLYKSVQIVKILVTHDGEKLSRVGDFSLAERLQGRKGNPLARVTLASG